jgi:hypothetical protein
MTFKEKLQELNEAREKAADKLTKIEEDQKHPGFQTYSVFDFKAASDAHADAANLYAELVSRMVNNKIFGREEYYE